MYCIRLIWFFSQFQFNFFLKQLSYNTKSIANKGKGSIGDDLCFLLKEKGNMRRLPGPGHPRFPDGIPIGFYYNVCTDTAWYDTEMRSPGNICCNRKSGKFKLCPKDKAKLDAGKAWNWSNFKLAKF